MLVCSLFSLIAVTIASYVYAYFSLYFQDSSLRTLGLLEVGTPGYSLLGNTKSVMGMQVRIPIGHHSLFYLNVLVPSVRGASNPYASFPCFVAGALLLSKRFASNIFLYLSILNSFLLALLSLIVPPRLVCSLFSLIAVTVAL